MFFEIAILILEYYYGVTRFDLFEKKYVCCSAVLQISMQRSRAPGKDRKVEIAYRLSHNNKNLAQRVEKNALSYSYFRFLHAIIGIFITSSTSRLIEQNMRNRTGHI